MILVYQEHNAEVKPGLSAHLKLMTVDMTAHRMVNVTTTRQNKGGKNTHIVFCAMKKEIKINAN